MSGTVLAIGVLLIVAGILTFLLLNFLFQASQDMLAETPGGLAKDYLSDDKYSKMIVEIDYVSDYGPDPIAFNYFKQKVNSYVDKTEVDFRDDDVLGHLHGQICADELDELEDENRDYYTGDDTAVLYIIYISGACSEGESTAGGMTFSGSSFAIYKETIEKNIPTQDPDHVTHRRIAEANILLHEFGHIVGLVNEAGFESEYGHEDQYHPYHSIYENSVMYFEATYEEYQDFDFYDREDLKAIAALPYSEPDPLYMYVVWIMIILGIIVLIAGAALRLKEGREVSADQSPEIAAVSAPATQDQRHYYCPSCGNRATYILEYERWYCYNCNKYLK